ncbi:MAG TPA: hypothetical protein VNB06_23105 [Thermoanaerobaculia bacterium]|nr:hypothetical protein [Thermoanaerobaculia bacterium]
MTTGGRGRVGEWIERRLAELGELEPVSLAVRLTCVYLVTKPVDVWYLKLGLVTLGIVGLVAPRLDASRALWLLVAFFAAWRLLVERWVADNHIYLFAYWCLALFLVLNVPEAARQRALALNARWLIGLAFLFAVLWKGVLSPDFVDGRFFRSTLLTDGRFRDLTLLAGGMTPQDLQANARAVAQVRQGRQAEAELIEPPRLKRLATAITWWTLVSEGAVAVAFLWPGVGRLIRGLRHGTLLLFAWTTYAFATVVGFGWLLVILGVSQCEPRERAMRLAYLATFFVVFAHQVVPWTTNLVHWLPR